MSYTLNLAKVSIRTKAPDKAIGQSCAVRAVLEHKATTSVEPEQTVLCPEPDEALLVLCYGPHGTIRQALLAGDMIDDNILAGETSGLGHQLCGPDNADKKAGSVTEDALPRHQKFTSIPSLADIGGWYLYAWPYVGSRYVNCPSAST